MHVIFWTRYFNSNKANGCLWNCNFNPHTNWQI